MRPMHPVIITRFHNPRQVVGSRISATAAPGRFKIGRVIIKYDNRLSMDQNHTAAAQALVIKLGWDGVWVRGTLPNNDRVFVQIEKGQEGQAANGRSEQVAHELVALDQSETTKSPPDAPAGLATRGGGY